MSISVEWELLSKAMSRNKDKHAAVLFAAQERLIELDGADPPKVRFSQSASHQHSNSVDALASRITRLEAEVSTLKGGLFSLITPVSSVNGEVLYRNIVQMCRADWPATIYAVQAAAVLQKLGSDHIAALAMYAEDSGRFRADKYRGPLDCLVELANKIRTFAWAKDGRIKGSLSNDLTAMAESAWTNVTLLVSAYSVQVAATGIGEKQPLPVGMCRTDRQIIGRFHSLIK